MPRPVRCCALLATVLCLHACGNESSSDAQPSGGESPTGGATAGGMANVPSAGNASSTGGAASGGEAGNSGAPGGCTKGTVRADEVILLGDSYLAIPGTLQTDLQAHARAAGAMGPTDNYRYYASPGTSF